MRCDDAQRMISDMQDGALSDRAERKVRRHMQTCEACRRFAKRVGGLQSVLGSLPDVPDEPERRDSYWTALPGTIRDRLDEVGGQSAFGSEARLRVLGAALAALLIVAVCSAAYEHGRSRALRAHLAQMHTQQPGPAPAAARGGAPEATLAACGLGAPQRRLFHEMSLAFTNDLKWVATDGDRIDFGLSHTASDAAAVAPGKPVIGIGLNVSRATDLPGARESGAISIVAFEGSSADFGAQRAGVVARFACTPRVLSDGRISVALHVGLSDPSTGAQSVLQTEVDLARGREAEVGRVMLGQETFVLRACADVWQPEEASPEGGARL